MPVTQLSTDVNASRYLIERKLGQGATGAVYLAKDQETGEHVALKKLFHVDAKSILRLKHEFRSLVGVAHPHLIKLYDMGRDDDCWFLTMEYLDGVDLATYVCPTDTPTNESLHALTPEMIAQDHARLLSAFLQLARGIQGLHAAGMLHRDLKPNNVLVVNGRVIVLDFGLVRDLSSGAATMTEDGTIAGTPAYMAPEQIKGAELGAASDWYAFGVMLYEALTGELPFDGTLVEILRRKLESEPLPVREIASDVPDWLAELCMALLRRDPAARPKGDEVIAAFERACQSSAREISPTGTDLAIQTESRDHAKVPLVGRQRELNALRGALRDAERGAAVAHVRGPSGTGKSMLVEEFLNGLEAEREQELLVLRSRCYELEQMPFKALDAVMDAIVRHLLHLDDLQVAQVLPPETRALVQLFPVLDRLRAVKRLATTTTTFREAINERQRAEVGLRQLVDRLAARQPIVLWIDDLQWGDLDSARILRSWMQQASDASILFLFSYRSEEISTSTCLAHLLAPSDEANTRRAVERVVDLAPLSSTDIRALCEQRLGAHGPAAAEVVERIISEAHGSPFFASQLTVMADAKLLRGELDVASLSIDALIAQTSAMLPDESKALLAVLAVGGRPMPPKLALQAAGVRRNGRALVHALRGLNLVRTREVAGERMLEVYHDRVREGVQALLGETASRDVHQRLLDVVEFSGHADPDWLHTLALGAGRNEAALQYGLLAAERANATLAFERAAELYERCIGLMPAMEGPELWTKLAVALVRCGRPVRAAEAYLSASEHATGPQVTELLQLSATHFLRSGQFDRGETLVEQVLAAANVDIPTSEAGSIAAILWERGRLALRGMKFKHRAENEVPPELLAHHDLLANMSASAQLYDPLRGTLLQLRAFNAALEAGEPGRIMHACGSAAIAVAIAGSDRAAREVDGLLERADSIAAAADDVERGGLCAARAISAFLLGRMGDVIEPSRAADRAFRDVPLDSPTANYYLRYLVASVRVGALYHLGRFRESGAELDELLREARVTQNRALLWQQTLSQTSTELIRDEVTRSRPRLDALVGELPSKNFGALNTLHMIAVMQLACTTSEFAWARALTDVTWQKFIRSMLHRCAFYVTLGHFTRARMLLNEYFFQGRKRELLAEVRGHLKVLQNTPRELSFAKSRLEARLRYFDGDRDGAAEILAASSAAFEKANIPAEAAIDRYARGLLSGSAGAEDVRKADQALRDMGMVNPAMVIRSYYPELVG